MKKFILFIFALFFLCFTAAPPSGTQLRSTATLNIRSGPCTDRSVVTQISKGTVVTSMGEEASGCGYKWYKVKGSFGTAWAASCYLEQVPSSNPGKKINQEGLNLIKSFEGLYKCKYKDPVGLWTICWGHLIKSGEVFPECLTTEQCEDLLKKDLVSFEQCVTKNVRSDITSNQFSALVSWTFNLGCGSLQSSTMLKRINDYSPSSVVCDEMKKWNKAGGNVLPGLVKRRQAECDLYSKNDLSKYGPPFNCGPAYSQGKKISDDLQCVKVSGKSMVVSTAVAYDEMFEAAKKDGINLILTSAFRTMAEQEYFYNCYITKKCNNGNLAAKPGYSNHQNGIAVDISVSSYPATYDWLRNNAHRFGFIRTVSSEKWHWELRPGQKCDSVIKYDCKNAN